MFSPCLKLNVLIHVIMKERICLRIIHVECLMENVCIVGGLIEGPHNVCTMLEVESVFCLIVRERRKIEATFVESLTEMYENFFQ